LKARIADAKARESTGNHECQQSAKRQQNAGEQRLQQRFHEGHLTLVKASDANGRDGLFGRFE
jgi:hypothetical protein